MFIIDWDESYMQDFRKRQAVGSAPDLDLRDFQETATARCPANIAAVVNEHGNAWIIYAYMWHGDIFVFGWSCPSGEVVDEGFVVGAEFEVGVCPDSPDDHSIITVDFQSMNFVNQFNVDDFLII